MSIRARYERELKGVFDNLVLMGRHLEMTIEKCLKALATQDPALAREVCADDKLIDELERNIEQACLRILLMEHPVANDFHEVTAALKMITDLERIGDQARDIAELTIQLEVGGAAQRPDHIRQMGVIVIQMVKDGVAAYVGRDLQLARSLDQTDDKVDGLFDTVMSDLTALIRENPDSAGQAILFMMITKYLERIGDHAVNIGEWVEYAVTGVHPGKE